LERLGIPTRILGELIQPGTTLGSVLPAVAEATGLTGVKVVAPGTHDTASAVMAVPAASQPNTMPDWAYISSGTWSLMGVETPQPVTSDLCRKLNFTNEGGVGGTVRLLKNIAGMWLVQECRRIWKQGGTEFGWDDLVRRAQAEPPLVSLIDPDHPSLVAPKDMPAAIRELCRQTNQPVPESEGAVIRCALESLALRYRKVLEMLEELTGKRLDTIHIVGGGSANKLLCQMAANACERRIVAGPVEATAIGNVMLQAVSDGAVGSIAQAREVIRDSFEVEQYLPQ
jgi:rhamnulokinase